MSVFPSHQSGLVAVSAASSSHISHYLTAERIKFKVHCVYNMFLLHNHLYVLSLPAAAIGLHYSLSHTTACYAESKNVKLFCKFVVT